MTPDKGEGAGTRDGPRTPCGENQGCGGGAGEGPAALWGRQEIGHRRPGAGTLGPEEGLPEPAGRTRTRAPELRQRPRRRRGRLTGLLLQTRGQRVGAGGWGGASCWARPEGSGEESSGHCTGQIKTKLCLPLLSAAQKQDPDLNQRLAALHRVPDTRGPSPGQPSTGAKTNARVLGP